MNSYEGLFIIKPDLKEDEKKNTVAQIIKAISQNGGILKNTQEWGRRQLVYRIAKQMEGVYYLFHFHIDPGAISKLRGTYKLNENILRLMIIKISNEDISYGARRAT